MQYLSYSEHAVSCFHQRAPVLSRQTTISYPRSQLAFRDDHGQILDEHGRAWSSGEGSFAENENVFLLDGGTPTNCTLVSVGVSRLQIPLKFCSRCICLCIIFLVISRSARSSRFRGRPFLGRLFTTPYYQPKHPLW